MLDDPIMQARLQRVRERRLFFVGGPVKSGTTWLQHLLDAHPEAACRGEGHLIRALLPLFKKALNGYNHRVESYNERLFSETAGFPTLGQDELGFLVATAAALLLGQFVEEEDGVLAVGEKTPANIYGYAPLSWFFPDARLISIIRDPRDCFLSNLRQTQRLNPKWLQTHHDGSITAFAQAFGWKWTSDVSAGLKMAKLCPDRVIHLRYEDLHSDPVPTLQRVCRLIEIDDSIATVEGCFDRASFERLSGGRSRGESDSGSFFRKGVVGDWRGQLDDEVVAALVDPPFSLMKTLGYTVE